MQVNFCTFTDSEGRSVAVNPLQVRCVRALPRDYTSIEFDKDHRVLVKEGVDQVQRGLTSIESE
jgi:hypothetical protein